MFETTATTAADLGGLTTHSNHALDEPSRGGLSGRVTGLDQPLSHACARSRPTATLDGRRACALLTDHGARPDICVHPVPAEGPESSAIMFGMVADIANRTLWVAPANPCEHPFEPYALDDLLS